MNKGFRSWPRPQNVIKIRAALKLDASSPPSAGAAFPSSALKSSWNIAKVVYNGTGDYTVHFGRPMPDKHCIMFGAAKAVTAGNGDLVNVHESDTAAEGTKRISVLRPSDAVEQNSSEVHVVFLA